MNCYLLQRVPDDPEDYGPIFGVRDVRTELPAWSIPECSEQFVIVTRLLRLLGADGELRWFEERSEVRGTAGYQERWDLWTEERRHSPEASQVRASIAKAIDVDQVDLY